MSDKNRLFFNYLLPELVDPKYPRSMIIRNLKYINPNYILDAKQKKM